MSQKTTISRRVFSGALLAAPALSLVPTLAPSPARANPGRFFSQFGGSGDPDHSAWTGMLKRHVNVGGDGINRVNYRAFKADQAALKAYIQSLAAVPARNLSRDAAFAYWANLYNAVTIDVVLDYYPVRSIRDIRLGGGGLFGRGPWKASLVTVEGQALSLDNIEHDILRPNWRDPRIHYAVNCASIGCPNLDVTAFTSRGLGGRLDAAAVKYINHPRGVRFANGGLRASKIYSWFSEDFGGASGLVGHWMPYAQPELQQKLRSSPRVSGYDYDWA
ncbi:MAG: DUF547 domain-containing protein, partial [Pseudomonadota bacterium]